MYGVFADVAELADALDLGSSGRPCRFDSCHPHREKHDGNNYRAFFMFENLNIV